MGHVENLLGSGNYTIPLILATHCVVYFSRRPGITIPLHCIWHVVTYTHQQNDTCVTLFAGLHFHCNCLPNTVCYLGIFLAVCHILFLRYCYLSDVASSQVCFTLRSCHLLQYSLRFTNITIHWICFAIIVFHTSEMYCPIFTLSSTIPSVLQSLH